MSTDPRGCGGKAVAEGMVGDSRAVLTGGDEHSRQQFEFLDAPGPEEMARARKELLLAEGDPPDELDVLDHARQKRSRGGRRKGSQNKRTKDFERYILQNGNRDPALIIAEIASTPAEVLVERSKALDPVKKRLDYGRAQALRVRCAEALMPYMHGKKPVQVELSAEGDFNLIIPGQNVSHEDAQRAAAGTFVLEAEYDEIGDEK